MTKRLYSFLVAEVVLLLLLVLLIVSEYSTITMAILILSPTCLVGFAAYYHVYKGRKSPHKIMLSILLYIVIALNLYSLIDPKLDWKGVLTSPVWADHGPKYNAEGIEIHGTGDDGMTMGVYYLSLINACISIALYELILLIRYAFKKK